MNVIRFLPVVLFLTFSTYSGNPDRAQKTSFAKWIGTTYESIVELSPDIVKGTASIVGPESEIKYRITVCGRKPWDPAKGSPVNAIVFFDSIETAGSKTLFRLLDILEIGLNEYPPNSEIRIGECSTGNTLETATVAVYDVNKAGNLENGLKPEKIWIADLKSFKFKVAESAIFLCMPQGMGDEGE